jgi:hypothetical protein
MKYFIVLFLLNNFVLFAKNIQLNGVEFLFQKSAINEYPRKMLMTILNYHTESNNSTLSTYKACDIMMMAKFIFNPVNKLANFRQGKYLPEKCIQADKENIKIRYLCLIIQSNTHFSGRGTISPFQVIYRFNKLNI